MKNTYETPEVQVVYLAAQESLALLDGHGSETNSAKEDNGSRSIYIPGWSFVPLND